MKYWVLYRYATDLSFYNGIIEKHPIIWAEEQKVFLWNWKALTEEEVAMLIKEA